MVWLVPAEEGEPPGPPWWTEHLWDVRDIYLHHGLQEENVSLAMRMSAMLEEAGIPDFLS